MAQGGYECGAGRMRVWRRSSDLRDRRVAGGGGIRLGRNDAAELAEGPGDVAIEGQAFQLGDLDAQVIHRLVNWCLPLEGGR